MNEVTPPVGPMNPAEAEAIRFALENNKKIAFIDSDAISYYENDDPFYENFFVEQESWEDFFNKYKDYEFKKVKQCKISSCSILK